VKLLESCGKEGETPVTEIRQDPRVFLSNTAHVKRCVNLRGPPRKAKYSSATDSEQVPRGKGEKNRCERSEIEPATLCLQGVRARKGDGVPFA
jgi:hypothetical protein